MQTSHSNQQLQQANNVAVIDMLVLGLAVAITLYLRLNLLNIPFDRDEGEYAYAGQQILQGNLPYDVIYNMKFPGVYYMYAAVFAVFGESVAAIRLTGLCMHLATTFFLFGCVSFLFSKRTGIYAAATFLIISLSFPAESILSNAEVFVVFFGCAGLWMMIQYLNKQKWLWLFFSGVMLCLSCLMKQPGAIYGVMALVVFLVYKPKTVSYFKLLIWIIGGLLPAGLLLGYLQYHELMANFIFFCFIYGREYATMVNGIVGRYLFVTNYRDIFLNSWIFVVISLVALVWSIVFYQQKKWWLLWLIVLLSALAVVPGLYFRKHYFIFLHPAVAIAAAYFLVDGSKIISNKFKNYFAPAVFAIGTLQFLIFGFRNYDMFQINGETYSRKMANYAIFADAPAIGNYIRSISDSNKVIGTMTNEPELLFYANRKSASGYLYMYPLFEYHPYFEQMTKEYMEQIVTQKPEIFVRTNIHNTGKNKNNIDIVLQWWETYKLNYELLRVYVTTGPETPYQPLESLDNYTSSGLYVEIYRRIDN